MLTMQEQVTSFVTLQKNDTHSVMAELDKLGSLLAKLDHESGKIKTAQTHLKLARDQLEKYFKEL